MNSVGRRRFLVILAGALGAAGVWLVRRPDEADVAASGRSGSSSIPASPTSTADSLPGPTSTSIESTTTTAAATSTTGQPSTTTSQVTTTSQTTTTTEFDATTEAGSISGTSLEVIPRAAWGAATAGAFTTHIIERITYHHSAVSFLDNRLGPARFRQHQAYHQSLGWPDIAYHLMIDRGGNVFEGRPFDAVGDTGTEYDPTGHFLPLCEGNFDEHDPSDAQLAALAAVVGWARTRFGTNAVGIHRDYASTSCPGDRLASRAADVAAASEQFLGLTMRMLSAEEGAARVAAIEAG